MFYSATTQMVEGPDVAKNLITFKFLHTLKSLKLHDCRVEICTFTDFTENRGKGITSYTILVDKPIHRS